MTLSRLRLACLTLAAALLGACGAEAIDDHEEVAHVAGDVMSSFDEASQGGAFASRGLPFMRERGVLGPSPWQRVAAALLPEAHAAGCSMVVFSTCTAGARSKTFNACSFGTATLSGSVTLTFSDTAACSMAEVPDSVTREANFTLTGRRGASLTVSAPGGGQRITRTPTGFAFSVLGLNRVLTAADGTKLAELSTRTLSDLSVTGSSRANRVMNGGEIEVKHALRNTTTTLTPEHLAWSSTCNCAVSGKLTGSTTAADAKVTAFELELTGCGTAQLTAKGRTRALTFDRCATVQ